MKRFFQKSELSFAIVWIIIYVVTMSIADGVSEVVGIQKVLTTPICIVLLAVLMVWIYKEKLSQKYGLTKGNYPPKAYLYFLPLIFTVSINFWGGVHVEYSLLETVLYVVSMLSVGCIEEIIFRGFLFKVLSKDNLKVAIIVSSVTFGFGHIVNLISGADLVLTLLQIVYAMAAGFLFTIIFHKSGSLLPCIITHSMMNATSVFACDMGLTMDIIGAVVLTVVCVAYALWICMQDKRNVEVE